MVKKFKKISFIFICVVLIVTCVVLVGCRDNIQQNKRRRINSVNHRGYLDAPENTLSAFRLSHEIGFDMVECDVQFTADNQPVLLHDSTVDRTSNGQGKISELTLEQARQLDFGSWKSEQYAGERIPTFQEFVDLCVQLQLHPYVEIKGATATQTQMLVDIVHDVGLVVTWISFDREVLDVISRISNARIGLLVNLLTHDCLEYLVSLNHGDVFVDCNYLTISQISIDLCKKYNVPLEVWTLNNQDIVANLDPYISGVTSDSINAQDVFNNL